MSEKEDFASLFGEFEQRQGREKRAEPAVGDKVSGTVISIQADGIFIDLGGKTEGMAEPAELTDAEGRLKVAVGDRVELVVSGKDGATGMLILGARHARRMHGDDGKLTWPTRRRGASSASSSVSWNRSVPIIR